MYRGGGVVGWQGKGRRPPEAENCGRATHGLIFSERVVPSKAASTGSRIPLGGCEKARKIVLEGADIMRMLFELELGS